MGFRWQGHAHNDKALQPLHIAVFVVVVVVVASSLQRVGCRELPPGPPVIYERSRLAKLAAITPRHPFTEAGFLLPPRRWSTSLRGDSGKRSRPRFSARQPPGPRSHSIPALRSRSVRLCCTPHKGHLCPTGYITMDTMGADIVLLSEHTCSLRMTGGRGRLFDDSNDQTATADSKLQIF